MPARKPSLPPATFARLGVKLFERAIKATRQNVSDGREVVAGASDPGHRSAFQGAVRNLRA